MKTEVIKIYFWRCECELSGGEIKTLRVIAENCEQAKRIAKNLCELGGMQVYTISAVCSGPRN